MHSRRGYVDLQVNGYADIDFNADELSVEGMAAVCRRLQSEGVAGILATVITADLGTMCRRLANICRAREADRTIADIVWGIHIEGPFISQETGYIGAHPKQHARSADVDSAKRLLEAAGGLTRYVTLAPECDPGHRTTRFLTDAGIRVSAGHTNASLDDLRGAVDAGLSLFTHFGNGCPGQLPRHDNILQRVLSLSNEMYLGFIADGVHVPFFALANYLRCCGLDRAFVVTDAICGAGQGPGKYTLGDREVIIDENLATWAADRSHLVGSAGTMQRSEENLRNVLKLSDAQIQQLMCDTPRKILGV